MNGKSCSPDIVFEIIPSTSDAGKLVDCLIRASFFICIGKDDQWKLGRPKDEAFDARSEYETFWRACVSSCESAIETAGKLGSFKWFTDSADGNLHNRVLSTVIPLKESFSLPTALVKACINWTPTEAGWNDIFTSAYDAHYDDLQTLVRFVKVAAEIGRLQPPEQTRPMSWSELGDALGCDYRTAKGMLPPESVATTNSGNVIDLAKAGNANASLIMAHLAKNPSRPKRQTRRATKTPT